MNIKRKLKKEKSVKKKIIYFSISIIAVMTYVVLSLYYAGYFKGFEVYFAFAYIIIVDLLLFVNILRVISDNKFEFQLSNGKVKIRDGLFSQGFSIPIDWIVFVDAAEKTTADDIEVLIVMEKGRRNKKFIKLNEELVRIKPYYKETYKKLMEMNPDGDYYYYIIRKSGSKKYYYLYLLYKNLYDAEFSGKAISYIRELTEEYNL